MLSLKKVVFGLMFLTSVFGMAQEENSKSSWSVEIDPATFVFRGYGVHLRWKPKNSEHFLYGVGAYAMDMPKLMVDLNPENKGKGWDVRLNQGYGGFAEYYINEVNKKFFVGTQIGVQQYKLQHEEEVGNAKYTNSLAMLYLGYVFTPFNKNFYIKPWAGVGYVQKIGGYNQLGKQTYDVSPVTMFATLHLGYKF